MAGIADLAHQFFVACETGKGWEGCAAFCHPDAGFSAQAEPLAEVRTLRDYAEWMKGIGRLMPDMRYELKAFATDPDRQTVCAHAVFMGTFTGEGGPAPPTGKSMSTDYVYVMRFEGDKISHMTKIWNSSWAMKQIGLA